MHACVYEVEVVLRLIIVVTVYSQFPSQPVSCLLVLYNCMASYIIYTNCMKISWTAKLMTIPIQNYKKLCS